jgi:hypothetical protein
MSHFCQGYQKGSSVPLSLLMENSWPKVFSDMDFLGWYSTGDRPTLAEIAIHRQITEINESPLFLQLSPGQT